MFIRLMMILMSANLMALPALSAGAKSDQLALGIMASQTEVLSGKPGDIERLMEPYGYQHDLHRDQKIEKLGKRRRWLLPVNILGGIVTISLLFDVLISGGDAAEVYFEPNMDQGIKAEFVEKKFARASSSLFWAVIYASFIQLPVSSFFDKTIDDMRKEVLEGIADYHGSSLAVDRTWGGNLRYFRFLHHKENTFYEFLVVKEDNTKVGLEAFLNRLYFSSHKHTVLIERVLEDQKTEIVASFPQFYESRFEFLPMAEKILDSGIYKITRQ